MPFSVPFRQFLVSAFILSRFVFQLSFLFFLFRFFRTRVCEWRWLFGRLIFFVYCFATSPLLASLYVSSGVRIPFLSCFVAVSFFVSLLCFSSAVYQRQHLVSLVVCDVLGFASIKISMFVVVLV